MTVPATVMRFKASTLGAADAAGAAGRDCAAF
jgi:hypothetical protein